MYFWGGVVEGGGGGVSVFQLYVYAQDCIMGGVKSEES